MKQRRYLAALGITLAAGALAPAAMAQAPSRMDFGPAAPADFSPPPPDVVRAESAAAAADPLHAAPPAAQPAPIAEEPTGGVVPDAVLVEDRSAVIVPAPTVVAGRDRLMVQPDEPSTQHRLSPYLFDPRGADYSGA